MAVKTYDPANCTLSVNGIIISGFAAGTFINIERSADMWSKQIGASGEGARTKSNDRSGSISFTLMKTADSNKVMSALAILDENTSGGAVPVQFEENGTDNVVVAETAWVRKMPNSEFSNSEPGGREWVMDTDILTMAISGN